MSDFTKKVHDVMNSSGMNWVDSAKNVRNNDINQSDYNISPIDNHSKNIKQSNTVTGVNGETFQIVNNPDLTPIANNSVNNNSQITPGVQSVQNAPKPQNYEAIKNNNYWNTGNGREQEIIDNINEGIKNDTRVQNAIATGDQETFKKIYGYDMADETKKKILDNQWAGSAKNDPDSLFTGIIAGRSYGENIQKLPEFKTAQSRANNYVKFSSASINELASYMNSGELLQGTQTYNDLIKNPEMAQKIQQAKIFAQNRGNMNLIEVGEKTSQEIRQNSPVTASMFDDGVITPDEYKQALQTPEITAKMQDVETKKNKYDKIKAKMKQIEEDVNNDTKYSGISATGKAALISDRQKALRYEMEIATDEYNNAVGTLTEMQKTQASILEMNYSLYKDNLAFNRQKEMSVFNSNLELAQKSRLFDMEQQKMREAMNDPYQAIPKMLDEFAKIGVTTQRSQQEIINEANAYIAQGGNLGEYMTKLRGLMQEKPEYQRYMAIQRGQMSDLEKLQAGQEFQLKQMALENQYGMQKMAVANQYDVQNALMQYNLKTASDREQAVIDMINKGIDPAVANANIRSATNNWKGASGQELLFAPEGTLIPTRLSQITNKNGGKECAEWVNDITGLGFGSLYSSKLSKAKEKSGTIGSVAVWQPSNNPAYRKYGHVGIIVGDDGKGNWLIKSSNYNVDGKISVDKVPKSKIDGYRSTNLGEKIMQTQNVGKNNSNEISDKQFTQYNQIQNRFSGNPQVKQFEETYAQGMNILTSLSDDSGAGDMSGIFAFMKSLDPSSVVRESEFEMAAKSAGVVENTKNIFQKISNGEILSEKQRIAFKKIAKQYIENRASIYETHYNDTIRVMKNQGIPNSYYPTNMAEQMRSLMNGGEQTSTTNSLTELFNSFKGKLSL